MGGNGIGIGFGKAKIACPATMQNQWLVHRLCTIVVVLQLGKCM